MEKKFVFPIVCMLIIAGSARAIIVPDASFEEATIPDGSWEYVNYNSPGWWCSSGATNGAWMGRNYVNGSGYPQVGHDGPSYTEFNALYVTQALEETYVEGTEYTLTVWAATHLNATGQQIFGYFLNADGSSNGWTDATILYDSGANSVPTSVGTHTWYEYNFTYIATAADNGAKIGIAFWGDGDTNMDDVTLDGLETSVIITETLGSTEVNEDGGTDSYDIVLQSSPANDVQVTITPDDTQIDIGSGPGVARVLTFTADPGGDWDSPQTINITADDDAVHEPDDDPHTTVITHTSQSDDSDYDDIPINPVSVAVYDNELGCGDWGYLEADINNDCYVDVLDLVGIAREWLLP